MNPKGEGKQAASKNQEKLDRYLLRLEKSLAQIATSERAEIITEISSHIRESVESGQLTLESVLSSLGEPEEVGNRYLVERGLKPVRKTFSPLLKWMLIGSAGAIVLAIVGIFTIAWNFTPIVDIDENGINLLGGSIKIKSEYSSEYRRESTYQSGLLDQLEWNDGDWKGEVDSAGLQKVGIKFVNGSFKVESYNGSAITYDCTGVSRITERFKRNFLSRGDGRVQMNFPAGSKITCDIKVPGSLSVHVKGINGSIVASKPSGDWEAETVNGNISLRHLDTAKYSIQARTLNGFIDSFPELEEVPDGDEKSQKYSFQAKTVNGNILYL